ncbi:hypothetical protein AB0E59_16750 [Lentzea sp. NPDC034063]
MRSSIDRLAEPVSHLSQVVNELRRPVDVREYFSAYQAESR